MRDDGTVVNKLFNTNRQEYHFLCGAKGWVRFGFTVPVHNIVGTARNDLLTVKEPDGGDGTKSRFCERARSGP